MSESRACVEHHTVGGAGSPVLPGEVLERVTETQSEPVTEAQSAPVTEATSEPVTMGPPKGEEGSPVLVVHPDGCVPLFLEHPVTCDQALEEFAPELQAALSRRRQGGRPLSGDHVLARGATYYVNYTTHVSHPGSPPAAPTPTPPAQGKPPGCRPAPQRGRSLRAERPEQGPLSLRRGASEGPSRTKSGPLNLSLSPGSKLPLRPARGFPVAPFDHRPGPRHPGYTESAPMVGPHGANPGASAGASKDWVPQRPPVCGYEKKVEGGQGEERGEGAACWGERAAENLMQEVEHRLPQAALARLVALNRSLAAPRAPAAHPCSLSSLPSLERCLNSGPFALAGPTDAACHQPLGLGECLCDGGSLVSPASTSSSSFHPLASPLTPPSRAQKPSSSSSCLPLASPPTLPSDTKGTHGCQSVPTGDEPPAHPKLTGERMCSLAPPSGPKPPCRQQGHTRGLSELSPQSCRASEAPGSRFKGSAEQSARMQELLNYLGSQPQERAQAARERDVAPTEPLVTQSAVFRRRTNVEGEAAAKAPLTRMFNISGTMKVRSGGDRKEERRLETKASSRVARTSSFAPTAREKLNDVSHARSHGRIGLVKSRTKTASDCKEDSVPKNRFLRALAALV